LPVTVSALLVLAGEASALDRYDVSAMSCDEVRTALQSSKKALLLRASTHVRGLMLYGLYVADPSICKGGQTAVRRSIRAAAPSACPVLQCADNTRSMSR
jgi:hypothetical protein